MSGPLAGRSAVVCGGAPVGTAIASALAAAGASTRLVDPPSTPGAASAALAGAHPDVVVWAHVEGDALLPSPVVALGEPDWVRRCELPLNSALWLLQAAHTHVVGRDGRVIVVCPSVALEGAAGLVPLATTAEAQRQLAKSLARRWGPGGVTVNVVTVPVVALAPALRETVPDATRTDAALLAADPLAAAASTVVWLAGPGASVITGTTIGADGGAVMAP